MYKLRRSISSWYRNP